MQSRVDNKNLYGENLKYGTYNEQMITAGSLVRGEVVDNNDPLSMGRVKVMIPSIYYGMPNEELPWAPVLQQGAGAGAGSMIIPEVGTIAVCAFEDGRHDKPMVVGTVYGTGSSSPRQVGNTIHCQNRQGSFGTTNNRTIENPETPVQGQNLNTPVLYKSHNGSYIQFDNTTGEDDINIVGHNGDYVRVGNKRIALETSAGDEENQGPHAYSGSHLFLNDHSPEYQEKGAQVELASKAGFKINMNDDRQVLTIVNDKENQKIEMHTDQYMRMLWTKGNTRSVTLDTSGAEIKAGSATIKLQDNGINIYLGSNSVNITGSSVVINSPNIVFSGSVSCPNM